MSLATRLKNAEASVGDALLWTGAQRLAVETGEHAEVLYADARRIVQTYGHLKVESPNGRVDIEPMLRGIAEGEDLDYDELRREARRAIRQQRTRAARRRNR